MIELELKANYKNRLMRSVNLMLNSRCWDYWS